MEKISRLVSYINYKSLLFIILLLVFSSSNLHAQDVDIEITKTSDAPNNSASEGDIFRYTIKIKNISSISNTATNVILKDLLPPGVTLIGINKNEAGPYDLATGLWNVGTLTQGTERQLKLDVQVNSGTGATTITNTASLYNLDQTDTDSDNNTSSWAIPINGADLEITKSVNDISPTPGDNITYTVIITNNGPDRANSVIINDDLPTGLTYISSSVTKGNNYIAATGIWDVGNINAGTTETLTILASVNTGTLGQTMANTAEAQSEKTPDGITNNNSSTTYIYVLEADLSITKTADVTNPFAGDLVTYTLNYTNSSIYDAPFVVITDQLPGGLTYVSDTSGGLYDPITGELNIATFPGSTSGSFDIVARVNTNTGGLSISNSTTIYSPAFDPNSTNNTSTADIQIKGADLDITQTVNNVNPSEGDTVIYTITLTNLGPDVATGVIVNDLVPNNLEFINYTPSIGTYNLTTHEWEVGNLTVGQVVTLTITATLVRPGTFINIAIASANESDGDITNNIASVTVNSYYTFNAGSCVIDMGISPQTINNGLKPYGLVYELSNIYKIPVFWSINPNKSWSSSAGATVTASSKEDQNDFVVNGTGPDGTVYSNKAYKGGPFIIPAEFVSFVRPIIEQYMVDFPGLTVDFDLPEFIAPLHDIITTFPNAVLDTDNGNKIESAFYLNAELFNGQLATSYRIASPSQITACDDMFALPHADPHDWDPVTEQQHLKDWVATGGYLWMACHAVSSMEGLVDIDGDGNLDMNFLTLDGLVKWKDHNNSATPPFDYSLEAGIFNNSVGSDPLMQFIGTVDGALNGGSEEIYLPKNLGFRPSTVFPVRDLDHPETQPGAEFPPGPAVSVAYGRAFGDPQQGLVMYEASHTIAKGTEAENVSAARIYGNMLLQGGIERKPKIEEVDLIPTEICSGESVSMSVIVTGATPTFTYEWSESCALGSFTTTNQPSTTYTAPIVLVDTECILRIYATDECSRSSFIARNIIIRALPIPPIDGEALTCIDKEKDYLTSTATGMSSYLWEVENGNIVGPKNKSYLRIRWDYRGDGIVKLTVTDTNGCVGINTSIVRFDNDCDGIGDYIDIDDDNDGILDVVEANGIDPLTDADGDGVSAYLDEDDSDPNIGDDTPGIEMIYDFDGDGLPNHLELDADNDGIPDVREAGFDDIDNDGIVDVVNPLTDYGANGLADIAETFVDSGVVIIPLPNTDAATDNNPNITLYNFLDVDSDNDGLTDAREAFHGHILYKDDNNDGIIDGFIDIADQGNGWDDRIDDDAVFFPMINSDSDSIFNYLDLDSDGDGIPDTREGNFEVPDGENDGIVGTGIPADTDGDGLADTNDPDFIGNVLLGSGFDQDSRPPDPSLRIR